MTTSRNTPPVCLPAFGRSRSRRYASALTALAYLGLLGCAGSDETGKQSIRVANAGVIGSAVHPGQQVVWSHNHLLNRGTRTVTIDGVRLRKKAEKVGLTRFTVAGADRGVGQFAYSYDPIDIEGWNNNAIRPALGAEIPTTKETGEWGVQILVHMRAPSRPGTYSVEDLEVEMRDGSRRFTVTIEGELKLCVADRIRGLPCSVD